MSNLLANSSDCTATLPPKAVEGMELFNQGRYFEAHEALEAAWRAETGPIRNLYRGVLQAAVVYLHLTRRNYPGVVKVYGRCRKWLELWPETCRGVAVGQLIHDLDTVLSRVQELGPDRLSEFDLTSLKPVIYAKS
ncbi:MAG TPA: DUF309 domain-containing protein [Anaerolineales bacterium]|nr:DUF309 domain-containing protein [Anaerolineales bacterium]